MENNPNRYLYGLDISLKETGIAVYDLIDKKFVLIDSFNTEKIYATKKYKGLHLNALKLRMIAEWMKDIIIKYPPYIVSIERMFSRFPTETQVIAKATGVIQCLLWNKPQELYPPKKVKSIIYHGNASKKDIENEILKRYPDLIMKNDNESDAVAVALCLLIDLELIEWEKSELPAKEKKKATKKTKKKRNEEK